jgi:hypothetical protein
LGGNFGLHAVSSRRGLRPIWSDRAENIQNEINGVLSSKEEINPYYEARKAADKENLLEWNGLLTNNGLSSIHSGGYHGSQEPNPYSGAPSMGIPQAYENERDYYSNMRRPVDDYDQAPESDAPGYGYRGGAPRMAAEEDEDLEAYRKREMEIMIREKEMERELEIERQIQAQQEAERIKESMTPVSGE